MRRRPLRHVGLPTGTNTISTRHTRQKRATKTAVALSLHHQHAVLQHSTSSGENRIKTTRYCSHKSMSRPNTSPPHAHPPPAPPNACVATCRRNFTPPRPSRRLPPPGRGHRRPRRRPCRRLGRHSSTRGRLPLYEGLSGTPRSDGRSDDGRIDGRVKRERRGRQG